MRIKIMICQECNNEFEGRQGAKYCSGRCRKAASRNKCDTSVTAVTDNPISVTPDNIEDVTDICNEMPEVEGSFEELPADVQRKIEYMSRARAETLGIDYEDEKAMRTARALDYMAKFPQYRHCRGAA